MSGLHAWVDDVDEERPCCVLARINKGNNAEKGRERQRAWFKEAGDKSTKYVIRVLGYFSLNLSTATGRLEIRRPSFVISICVFCVLLSLFKTAFLHATAAALSISFN